MATTDLRRTRERDLVAATRALFDERGMLDAPIEEIAKSVGIARGLVYRQFSSKDELFVLTVTDYLGELEGVLADAAAGAEDPVAQLDAHVETFARYCYRYPAFLDASLFLMQRPAKDLQDSVSESVWLRLGQGMMACIDRSAQILRSGSEAGVMTVRDPDFAANLVWTSALGAMHLARSGVGLRALGPGVPELFTISADDVVEALVESARLSVRAVS